MSASPGFGFFEGLAWTVGLTWTLAPITAAWVGLPLSLAVGIGIGALLKRPFSWL